MTQALISRRSGVSVKFIGTPDKDTLQHLRTSGFTYDGRSRQWYRTNTVEDVRDESAVLDLAGA